MKNSGTHLSDYDYHLPPGLIARHPPARREAARMLVLDPATGTIVHRRFVDFPRYLQPGDLVVLNDSRVIPARVFSDDQRLELLLVEPCAADAWRALARPGRRARRGTMFTVGGVRGHVLEIAENGERIVRFDAPLDLERVGLVPLPPYLEREPEPADRERYQTVYARKPGAVAAPTAGLHFTQELLASIPHAFVTLHVGPGTFRPVQVDDLSAHRMHSERYQLTPETAAAINAARRVIAIGTTTVRVLESCAIGSGRVRAGSGRTDLFIRPPFNFRVVDLLLTNFHLPKSTLLMLVSAFAGRELVLRAYAEAVREGYRFFSYGDCMLVTGRSAPATPPAQSCGG